MNQIKDLGLVEKMIGVRRDLHRNPELAWHEFRTTEVICSFLKELGIEHKKMQCGSGVIADIPGETGIPCIALRADIDALPIHEETGLDFASGFDGKMHACAHDGHTSMLLGAAELLAGEPNLPCPVRLLFQPAEELGAGALAMIKEDALHDVKMIFGGHIDRHYRTGIILVTDGVVNASTDTFKIDITGKGGHAARPHESVDAVVVGSLMVMALQTIVSREVNPAHPSVVTVGTFNAGTASNVIANKCILEGTIRSQDDNVRSHLKASVERIARSVGQLHGANINFELTDGTPALRNTPEVLPLARKAAQLTVADKQVRKLEIANMGGEDFAYYLDEIPGCYVRFGAQLPGLEGFPAHSSKFDFDEKVLEIGARFFYNAAIVAGKKLHEKS